MTGLTKRQTAVVRLVACGMSNKEIACRLGIAEQTVKHHLTAVYASWKVNDRTQAAICAFALGVIKPDEAYQAMIGCARQEEL